MNQETALKIIIGIAKRSPEVTECKSSKTQKELQQAIRVCQTLADNREAKRSWRESCGHSQAKSPDPIRKHLIALKIV